MSNDAYHNQDPRTLDELNFLEAERQANKKYMTIEQALEQGYERCGHRWPETADTMLIKDLTHEDVGPDMGMMIAEKEPFYVSSISSNDIAAILSDHIQDSIYDDTGDEACYVPGIVSQLDFTATANMINEALKDRKYWKLTDIELV